MNLGKLECLISVGGKRPVQILELRWSMKVTTKLFVFCHREVSTYKQGKDLSDKYDYDFSRSNVIL